MLSIRELHHAWRTETEKLIKACVPGDPPFWRTPSGADPFDLLDVQAANRALDRGRDVAAVAEVLAARRLARAHGHGLMRQAAMFRAMPAPPPERPRGPGRPRKDALSSLWDADRGTREAA